jgi:nucleotide-binding universal stress UspA family protein
MIDLKKILVATDFQRALGAALTYARELARKFGAELTVLHVVDDVAMHAYGVVTGTLMVDPAVQHQYEAEALTQLAAAITNEDRLHLGAHARLLVSSTPAAAIVSYAQSRGSISS